MVYYPVQPKNMKHFHKWERNSRWQFGVCITVTWIFSWHVSKWQLHQRDILLTSIRHYGTQGFITDLCQTLWHGRILYWSLSEIMAERDSILKAIRYYDTEKLIKDFNQTLRHSVIQYRPLSYIMAQMDLLLTQSDIMAQRGPLQTSIRHYDTKRFVIDLEQTLWHRRIHYRPLLAIMAQEDSLVKAIRYCDKEGFIFRYISDIKAQKDSLLTSIRHYGTEEFITDFYQTFWNRGIHYWPVSDIMAQRFSVLSSPDIMTNRYSLLNAIRNYDKKGFIKDFCQTLWHRIHYWSQSDIRAQRDSLLTSVRHYGTEGFITDLC